MNIIFFGTPDFAVASLKALVESGKNVIAVVTAPDKPGGRGMKLQESAVKKYAIEHHLPVLQPEKLKSSEFLETLQHYHADLQVVVAFRMLPEAVWDMPPLGTINVHASLLPNYRGAAPINWAIMNGENETGVTTFKLKHAIDTGNILLQKSIPISPIDTAGSLHDKLMELGARVLIDTIEQMEKGTLSEFPQQTTEHNKHAPKIFTETCKIDWTSNAEKISCLIRGLSPYPAAFTELNGKKLKVFDCTAETTTHHLHPGVIVTDNTSYLKFACADGFIAIHELQLEGKTKMKTADFLRGNKVDLRLNCLN